MIDGVIIIDKPAGKTSHDIVIEVKKILGVKKPAIPERSILWLREFFLYV